MDIFKTMKTNLALAIIMVAGVVAVAVMNHYPGRIQIKGPMGTEVTVDAYPTKNQPLTDKVFPVN